MTFIVFDAKTSAQLQKLEESVETDPIKLVSELGEDSATFFQHSNLTGWDFSRSDVTRVSFAGSYLDGCTFRKGQLSAEARAAAHSAENIIEVDLEE